MTVDISVGICTLECVEGMFVIKTEETKNKMFEHGSSYLLIMIITYHFIYITSVFCCITELIYI